MLNIEDGAEIESSHVGIEFRAGTLNVNGGTITSTTAATANSSTEFHRNTAGASFTDGVAIAISKSSRQRNITANINGGTISGYAALAVANPNKTNNAETTTTVNVTGGTLISTSKATADESSYDSEIPEYTLKGKNAIVNFDKDVTVNIENTTVRGSIAANLTGRSDGNTGYNIGEGNDFSNFTYPESGGQLISYYTAQSADDANFTVAVLGSDQGWNKKTDVENTWEYLVQGATGAGAVVATLAPKAGSENTLALTSTLTDNTEREIDLDLTNTAIFSNIDTYTTLDASGIIGSNIKFNITGNDKIAVLKF